MPNFEEFYHIIKRDYGQLWNYKVLGNTLEIITPHSTVSSKFVSVYLTQRGDNYIISDGGDVEKNNYLKFEDEDITVIKSQCYSVLKREVKKHYNIANIVDSVGTVIYYKKTNRPELVTSLIHDVTSFITTVVNGASVFTDKRESEAQTLFTGKVNKYLRAQFDQRVSFNYSPANFPKQLTFNAVIEGHTGGIRDYNLISYVTGSTAAYFQSSIARAHFDFDFVTKFFKEGLSEGLLNIKKIAIIDNESTGYVRGDFEESLELVASHSNNILIPWSEHRLLPEIIN